jgi:hypothetical protein
VPSMVRYMPIRYATGRYMHVQEVLTDTYQCILLVQRHLLDLKQMRVYLKSSTSRFCFN